MKAGPYIRAMIEQELDLARDFRALARDNLAGSEILLRDAAEAEQRARRWAQGTDYVIGVVGEATTVREEQ